MLVFIATMEVIVFLVLVLYGVVYFNTNYKIISLELYEKMANIVDEYATQLEKGDTPTEELAGGVGFQVDYNEEEEEE